MEEKSSVLGQSWQVLVEPIFGMFELLFFAQIGLLTHCTTCYMTTCTCTDCFDCYCI